ncbi:hypothetical protein D3C84_1115030 [compost metagenome]
MRRIKLKRSAYRSCVLTVADVMPATAAFCTAIRKHVGDGGQLYMTGVIKRVSQAFDGLITIPEPVIRIVHIKVDQSLGC